MEPAGQLVALQVGQPPLHVAPMGHICPQPRQLSRSVAVSTHWLPQQVPTEADESGQSTPGFAGPQVGAGTHCGWLTRDPSQKVPGWQTLPQAPQLLLS